MKKLFSNLAILGLVILAVASCNKDEKTESQKENFYTVQVNLTGEINVGYVPLTRASLPTGVYGIQVYSTPVELEEGEEEVWTPYAYYVYNGISPSLSINLYDGYKYSFAAALVVDGNTRMPYWNTGGQHSAPFELYIYGTGSVTENIPTNHATANFIYNTELHLMHLSLGLTNLEEGMSYSAARVERYYGCNSAAYIPSAENTSVNINMKRTSFGAKFIVSGTATSGTVKFYLGGDEDCAPQEITLSSADNVTSDIYSFVSQVDAYLEDEYKEEIPVLITWNDGEIMRWSEEYNITFQRNTTTVVTLQLDNKNTFGITIEDSEAGIMPEPGTNDVTIVDGEIQ